MTALGGAFLGSGQVAPRAAVCACACLYRCLYRYEVFCVCANKCWARAQRVRHLELIRTCAATRGGFALRFVLLTYCFPRLLCIALFLLLCPVLALQSVPRIDTTPRCGGSGLLYSIQDLHSTKVLLAGNPSCRCSKEGPRNGTQHAGSQYATSPSCYLGEEEGRVSRVHLVHRPAIHVRAWSMNIQQRSHSQQLTVRRRSLSHCPTVM